MYFNFYFFNAPRGQAKRMNRLAAGNFCLKSIPQDKKEENLVFYDRKRTGCDMACKI